MCVYSCCQARDFLYILQQKLVVIREDDNYGRDKSHKGGESEAQVHIDADDSQI